MNGRGPRTHVCLCTGVFSRCKIRALATSGIVIVGLSAPAEVLCSGVANAVLGIGRQTFGEDFSHVVAITHLVIRKHCQHYGAVIPWPCSCIPFKIKRVGNEGRGGGHGHGGFVAVF
jgi:hypothetical protein